MKLSISKLLIALNCLVIIFWGSIINRMDYTTIIYMGTDLNFYVIDNQYITSWYDSGFVFLILCVFICVHFIIELTKIIVDKHIEISLRKKSLVLLIGMILVMFYSFIIDVLTWYQPIFIISFIIALSNWNIKEAKKECEYTR